MNAIRAFEAVVRNKSFSAAAQELSVTPTAISHQIRHLEEVLGHKLIERGARSISLLPAGERIFPLLQEGLDKLAEAFAETNDHRAGGTLRVSTTMAFAERWLLPRLSGFIDLKPGVVVDVNVGDALSDMRTSGVDIAIRYGRETESGLSQFRLFHDQYVPVVKRKAGELPAGTEIEDYRNARLLGFEWKNRLLGGPTWSDWLKLAKVRDPIGFKINWFSEEHIALQSLDLGHGPLLASDIMVSGGLRNETLVRIAGPVLPGLTFTVIVSPQAARNRNARAFCDWLRAEAETTFRPL